jgi:hypothetical protein
LRGVHDVRGEPEGDRGKSSEQHWRQRMPDLGVLSPNHIWEFCRVNVHTGAQPYSATHKTHRHKSWVVSRNRGPTLSETTDNPNK